MQGYESDTIRNKAISSESIDGYSVTYGKATTDSIKAMESEIKSIIQTYLSQCKLEDNTPYLYRGVK